jgi:anti-sigma factor RsiW
MRDSKRFDPFAERLKAWLDGELDPSSSIEVERHWSGCEDCRAAVEEYRRISERLREWAGRPVPMPDAAAIRLQAKTVDLEERRLVHIMKRVAAAAAVFLAMASILAWWTFSPPANPWASPGVSPDRDAVLELVIRDPIWEED